MGGPTRRDAEASQIAARATRSRALSYHRPMARAPHAAVLFVCLGNICRSPTAEAVFRAEVHRSPLAGTIEIDSAGTGGWHVGSPPDWRAIAHAEQRGYDLTSLRARQVSRADFDRFGWILAMDRWNLADLERMRPEGWTGTLGRLLDFAPAAGTRDVPDPYDGGPDGFERVLDLVELGARGLLARIAAGR
jgi:protein-tyrosine phosphatase